MLDFVADMLQCPSCHADLDWDVKEQVGERIKDADIRCRACAAVYSVRDEIGLFLTTELSLNDSWEQVDHGLIRYLNEHPDLEQCLMDTPLEMLTPADQFLRGLALETRGNFEQAKMILESANARMYTPEYHICRESQFHFLIERLKNSRDPIVDLASGRCELVEEMTANLDCPVIASDFSPSVLRLNQRRLKYFDRYANVSLIAFDARRTPFKDRCIRTMTTNLGLANIENPDALMKELRRVVWGTFWAISVFYPPEDAANAEAIDHLGISPFLFHTSAQENFTAAGWKSMVVNICEGRALPTPASEIFPAIQIDNLPVAETHLEWSILRAT